MITAGTLTALEFTNYVDDYRELGELFDGPDRTFRLDVPANTQVRITATPSTPFDLTLTVAATESTCGLSSLDEVNDGRVGDAETLTFTNRTSTTRTIFLIIDTLPNQALGTFTLTTSLHAPPADDLCGSGATPLSPGATLTAESTSGYTDDFTELSDTCIGSNAGPDRVYAFTVPPGKRGIVTINGAPGSNPGIDLIESSNACTTRLCAGTADVRHDEDETATVFNASSTTRTYFAIIDAQRPMTFDLTFTIDTPGTNDTCSSSAVQLINGFNRTDVIGDTMRNDYGTTLITNCSLASGADRIYRLTIPAGSQATVTVAPFAAGGLDPVLTLLGSDCDATPRACLASEDRTGVNETEVLNFANETSASMDLFFSVAHALSSTPSSASYTITSRIRVTPPGEACSTAFALSTGITTGTNVGATHDAVFMALSGCNWQPGIGGDVLYAITVPNTKRLVVSGTSSADLVLDLFRGPANLCRNVTSCFDSADDAAAGVPESVSWTNTTGTSVTTFLKVSTWGAPGSYSLNVSLQ